MCIEAQATPPERCRATRRTTLDAPTRRGPSESGAWPAHRVSPRVAVTVFFALDGFAVASFFARLPAIQDRLNLSNGRIGLALLALTLALLVSQPVAGALASRRGSAPLVTAGGLMVSVAIVTPAFAESFGALVLCTAAIGFTTGVLDLTMNMQGVAVERRLPRPILSGLHAAFSIGVLGGALAAGAAASAGQSPQTHLLAVGILSALVTLAIRRALLPGRRRRGRAGPDVRAPVEGARGARSDRLLRAPGGGRDRRLERDPPLATRCRHPTRPPSPASPRSRRR